MSEFNERDLFDFMLENVIRYYLGSLSDVQIAMLDELGDWKSYYESKIVSAWIGKIIYDNFKDAIQHDLNTPYEIIIKTVMREISGSMQYSGIVDYNPADDLDS